MRPGARRGAAAAIAASLLFVATEAAALDDGPVERLPVAYSQRPLTLPQLVLEPGVRAEVARDTATFVNLAAGAALGLTDDLQVSALVAPLQLAPSVTYGQVHQPGPAAGLTYRPYHARTQVGLHVDVTAITLPHASGAVVRAGLPLRFRAGDECRIDFGVYVPVTAARTTVTGLDLPLAVAFNVGDAGHLGVTSGFTIPSFDAFSFAFPLGIFAGYTFSGDDGPLFEIDPYARLPRVLATSVASENPLSIYEVGVALRAYFYL